MNDPKNKIYSGPPPALDINSLLSGLGLAGATSQPDRTRAAIDPSQLYDAQPQQQLPASVSSELPLEIYNQETVPLVDSYQRAGMDQVNGGTSPELQIKSLSKMSPAYQQQNKDAKAYIMDTQGETEEGNIDKIRDLKLLIYQRNPELFFKMRDAYFDKNNKDNFRVETLEALEEWHSKNRHLVPNITNWETLANTMNLFPNAFANLNYQANPSFYEDKKYSIRDARAAEEKVSYWTSPEGLAAIGTVLASSLAGTPGGYAGQLATGSIIPALVGQGVAWWAEDAPVPFSEGTDYEIGHFLEGLEAGMGGPRWKVMESQNWAQIIGSGRGSQAAYYEMTAFDLPAEIVGMGLGAGVGRLWGRYTTQKIAAAFKNVGKDSRGVPVGSRTWREGDPIFPKGRPPAATPEEVIAGFIVDDAFGKILYPIIKKRESRIRSLHRSPGNKAAKEKYPLPEPKWIKGTSRKQKRWKVRILNPKFVQPTDIEATMVDGSKSTIYPIPENQPAPLAESTVDFVLRNADREILELNSEVIEAISRTPVRQKTVDGEWVEAPQQLSVEAMEQIKKERAGQKDVIPPPMDGFIDSVRFYLAKKYGPNSVIWEQLVAPAIYGIGRQGRDGLVAKERYTAAAGKLIYAMAEKAGVGTFSEAASPLGKALIKGKRAVTDDIMPFGLVFKGARNEANARSIIDAIQSSDEAMQGLPDTQRAFAFLVKNMFDSYLENINLRRLEAYGPDAKGVEIKGRENYFPHMFTLSYFDGVTHDLAKMSNEEIELLNSFLARQAETPYKFNPEGADKEVQELDWLKSLGAPQDLIDEGAFKNHFFPKEMMWFGNLLARETSMDSYSRNILSVMDKYVNGAEQVINMAVPTARFEAGLDQLKLTNSIDDATYRYLKEWSEETLHNRVSRADRRVLPGEKGLLNASFRLVSKAVNRASMNLIPGSLTFMGQNFLSFPNLYMVQGIKAGDIVAGAAKALWYDSTPSLKRAVGNISDKEILDGVNGAFGRYGVLRNVNELSLGSALRESQVMQMRFDTGWERSAEEALKSGDAYKMAVGFIDAADTYMVAMAYHTGKRAAYRQYGQMRMAVEDGSMELPYFIKARYGEPPVGDGAEEWWNNTIERLSRSYGDDLAGDTQAVYNKMMQSPMQRRAAFKTAAPFQTWVTQASSLARDTFVGKGATGSARAATWNKYTPAMKLGTGIKLYGAMIAANSLARVTGLRPPYNPETFVPGGENLITLFDITDRPNRGSSLMVINNMRRIMAALGSIAENGFDYDDVSQRQGLEAALIQFPHGMGLQLYNRVGLNLVDRGRGGINIGQGGGKASWLSLGGRRNKRLGRDALGAIGKGVENIGQAITEDPAGMLEGMALGTKNMRAVRAKKSKFVNPSAEVYDTIFPSLNPVPVKGEAPVWAGHMQGMLERLGLDKRSMRDYGDK